MMSLSTKEITDARKLINIIPEEGNRIPKIIHYCWFGGKPLPEDLKKCLDTWEKLHGYTIMRWDESNCTFDENDFVRNTYKDGQIGFIGDYYRAKAVYEYGGIYLDTDVKVKKSFDPLLKHKAFLNFIFDCSVGTAIIGSEKHNPLFKGIMDMYDNTVFLPDDGSISKKSFECKDGKIYVHGYATSNYYYTYYILKHYPQFMLNNTFQDLGDFVIYPKELFEIGTLTGRHFAIHLNAGVWRLKGSDGRNAKNKIKELISRNERVFDFVQILVRRKRYRILNKSIPFYEYSIAQKNGDALPEL
ncbi:Glycosyltransferase sugar-binding region containing DXD motif-containing protein [Butyrivibrio sp. Su6]|uniref:glycosyltransferase family 32 protein n=1 Tax=Butyrivibrio sp. Su6 TaxID=1520810 RepID=UPI00089E4E8F|nr:glycosyltransferase [Butyrivibrio sp. Su6]SEG25582.1 Glycosyltransferase sugar-binding region containing DXD motif-containing protein [Butyrivibrio sp. Su6]